MTDKPRKKSAARIEKDRKRKAEIKRRQLIKKIAIIVVVLAFVSLIISAFTAPPKMVG